ncbi:MAG TPA: metal-sulfur cluster assembly factor [Longimicrobiales bacterium]
MSEAASPGAGVRADAGAVAGVDARAAAAADVGAGAPLGLPAGVRVRPGTESLWSALREVDDPEFPVSVVDLGLIYDVRRDGPRVDVDLTFTATACPCMDFIKDDVRERLLQEPGVDVVEVHIVWDPPWTRDRMSAAAKERLRAFGVAT